jgi:hypothetical protein
VLRCRSGAEEHGAERVSGAGGAKSVVDARAMRSRRSEREERRQQTDRAAAAAVPKSTTQSGLTEQWTPEATPVRQRLQNLMQAVPRGETASWEVLRLWRREV